MALYYDEARQDFYDELKKLDKAARRIGKTLKTVAKFFLILFLYLSLNAIVAVLTNQTRSVSPSIFNLVQESLRTFVAQNLPVLLACENGFDIYYTISIVFMCGIGIAALFLAVIFVSDKPVACGNGRINVRKYEKTVNSAVVAVAYKQHVSFLS